MTLSEPNTLGARTRRVLAWASIASCVHVAGVVLALMFPFATGFATRKSDITYGDIRLYHGFAVPMLEGRRPYRDYEVEYPILAIPVFAAPLIAGNELATYKYAFIVEMLLVDVVLTCFVARRVASTLGIDRVPGRLAWYSAYFLALCPLAVLRFDLVPALMAFAAACWLGSGRMISGSLAAGLGTLIKVIPGLVLVPLLAIPGGLRPRMKGLVAFVITVVAGVLTWWGVGREGLIRMIVYHGERGLEIESIPALVYILASKAAGIPTYPFMDHGGISIAGPGSSSLARLTTFVQVALLLVVISRARRATLGDSLRLATASLVGFLIASKVYSPQFMIWLVPFLAATDGPRSFAARWIFLGCCVLTSAIYPHRFEALVSLKTEPIVILSARAIGMIALFAILLGGGKSAEADHSHSIVPGGLLVTS